MNVETVAERLGHDRFVLDEAESHIEIDQDECRRTGTGKRLVAVCPAGVYSELQDGTIVAEYAACLECGTCLAVASPGTLRWRYPRGGFGVGFREG